MKKIFDWLREHLEETAQDVSPNTDKLVVLARVERLLNEAEAKWESDCCEWAHRRYHANCLCECVDVFVNYDWALGFKVCPYCGKPIKISEVE